MQTDEGRRAKQREYTRRSRERKRKENPELFRQRQVWDQVKATHGITQVDYHRLLEEQEGECAICGIHCLDVPYRLQIDHDHATGKVRGLLCRPCNSGLGFFGDGELAVAKLQSAIRYLEEK